MTDPLTYRKALHEYRETIDKVDDNIIQALRFRVELSKETQQLRRANGEPGKVTKREKQIVNKYRKALGAQGAELAEMILGLSR